jgi:hypothetical protein
LGWLPAVGEGGRQAGEGEPWISAEVLPRRPAVIAGGASAPAIEDPEELATEAEQALAEQPARERRRRLAFDGWFFSLIPLGGIAVVAGVMDPWPCSSRGTSASRSAISNAATARGGDQLD